MLWIYSLEVPWQGNYDGMIRTHDVLFFFMEKMEKYLKIMHNYSSMVFCDLALRL